MFYCQRVGHGSHLAPNFLSQPQRASSSWLNPEGSLVCLAQCEAA